MNERHAILCSQSKRWLRRRAFALIVLRTEDFAEGREGEHTTFTMSNLLDHGAKSEGRPQYIKMQTCPPRPLRDVAEEVNFSGRSNDLIVRQTGQLIIAVAMGTSAGRSSPRIPGKDAVSIVAGARFVSASLRAR
jgi:hypothetical protein